MLERGLLRAVVEGLARAGRRFPVLFTSTSAPEASGGVGDEGAYLLCAGQVGEAMVHLGGRLLPDLGRGLPTYGYPFYGSGHN